MYNFSSIILLWYNLACAWSQGILAHKIKWYHLWYPAIKKLLYWILFFGLIYQGIIFNSTSKYSNRRHCKIYLFIIIDKSVVISWLWIQHIHNLWVNYYEIRTQFESTLVSKVFERIYNLKSYWSWPNVSSLQSSVIIFSDRWPYILTNVISDQWPYILTK